MGGGIASLAFADLLSRKNCWPRGRQDRRWRPSRNIFPAKAKAVISIFCYGGVSQVDTFDPKPELLQAAGREA